MNDRYYLAWLIVFQLLAIALIQPYGNFPLNDDWAYAHSAIWFNSEHRIRLSNWIAMNLLPQAVAGGLVTAAVGFSFDALRHLTQIVALLTSISAFYFFRSAALTAAQAFVATLVLVAMPSWPVLANSFMTDIYGLVFALSAAALFIRLLEKHSAQLLFFAILLSVIGVLQRQVVVVVPFAFMLSWFWIMRERTARGMIVGLVALCALALATLAHLFREKRNADSCRLFLAIVVGAYLAPFVITDYIDRYLLFALPFLIALWARTWPISEGNTTRFPRMIALAWILVVTGISIAATHDYFAWNRARWYAIRHAEGIGVTVDQLDGGFEFNGFYGYETRVRGASPGKSWWWVRDDQYVVAFSLVPGYEVAATFPVRGWLARTPDQINLLRRQHESPL